MLATSVSFFHSLGPWRIVSPHPQMRLPKSSVRLERLESRLRLEWGVVLFGVRLAYSSDDSDL
jgi:hypothetical protein